MKKKASKRKTKGARKKKVAPAPKINVSKAARSLELHEWLDEVHQGAKAAAATGVPQGACLVDDPQTGGRVCVRTDQVTCTTQLKGEWIGGPCGPD